MLNQSMCSQNDQQMQHPFNPDFMGNMNMMNNFMNS